MSSKIESAPVISQSAGPDRGFGRLWRKIYSIALSEVDIQPEDLISNWKEDFGDFWPGENTFNAPIRGLKPGEMAGVELEMPGGVAMSTGVRLVYSEPTRFSLAAPPGHVFCGWTTFSADHQDKDLMARVEVLMRGSDPLFEIGLELFGHKREDGFWLDVLRNLAKHHGFDAEPTLVKTCVDRRYLVRNSGNVRANSVLRNGIHRVAGPFRSIRSSRGTSIDPDAGSQQ